MSFTAILPLATKIPPQSDRAIVTAMKGSSIAMHNFSI
jgi:hypothetical protein